MKILVIGSGGREHALVWKLAQSPKVQKIYCAPGNAGIAQLAQLVPIKADASIALADFAQREKIDLTVVGPEQPLVGGIVDLFQKRGLKIFGPTQKAAQLEGSKVFAKQFMVRNAIPTARHQVFRKADKALQYLKSASLPMVIKADGLAAGKGVVVAKNLDEASHAVKAMLVEKIFGAAGNQILIEECLAGEEISVLALLDGKSFLMLESSQDHKRIYDDDRGPNTGGMGAISPSPRWNEALADRVAKEIFQPVLKGFQAEGIDYRGLLYAGLMLDAAGNPNVLEFNVRFGDPETQAVLARLDSDLADAILSTLDQKLSATRLVWKKEKSVCVVMASGGYPGPYNQGIEIRGLEEVANLKDTVVFHAGTAQKNGKVVTSGGRVLGVTAWGADFKQAREKAYAAVAAITFEKAHFRRDIGKKALEVTA